MSEGIPQIIAEGRADRQFLLVGEHWRSVRHLWLDIPGPLLVARLGPNLPPNFWFGAGMAGLANIKRTRNGRFVFAEGRKAALIVPAYHVIPGGLDANPAAHVEHLVDLVAVDVDHPDRFWRRRGDAVVLGNAYLEVAGQDLEPVPVYRNPLTWLRAGGAGIVVLDWDYARDLLLDHDLIAEDVELGNRLEASLKPSIWVMEKAA